MIQVNSPTLPLLLRNVAWLSSRWWFLKDDQWNFFLDQRKFARCRRNSLPVIAFAAMCTALTNNGG
jgi:hypothetical protein